MHAAGRDIPQLAHVAAMHLPRHLPTSRACRRCRMDPALDHRPVCGRQHPLHTHRRKCGSNSSIAEGTPSMITDLGSKIESPRPHDQRQNPDFDHDGVQEHHRVDRVQRSPPASSRERSSSASSSRSSISSRSGAGASLAVGGFPVVMRDLPRKGTRLGSRHDPAGSGSWRVMDMTCVLPPYQWPFPPATRLPSVTPYTPREIPPHSS